MLICSLQSDEMTDQSESTTTEVLYLEPLPPTTEMQSRTYTVNRSPKQNQNSLKNVRLATVGTVITLMVTLTSFLVYNSVSTNNMLSHISGFNTANASNDNYHTNNCSNQSCDCVTAYKQQMLLIESWQSNGTREFFLQCRYQYSLGNSNYFSICNTSSPLRPIYDLRYFVSGDNSFYPTVRGFSLTLKQAHILRKLLIDLLENE